MSAENPFRRTALSIRPCAEPLGRKEKSLWMGSCFTENLGPWLSSLSYPVKTNPFGVVYHPLVMGKLLFSSCEEIRAYNFLRDGVWLNFLLGAPFAAESETMLNRQIEEAACECQEWIKESKCLFLTFGTAFLHHHRDLGPVGKCHKMPAGDFEKKRSSVEEIAGSWKTWILKLRENRPDLRVVLSLSPVRHSRDGLEENALSKSVLRLAVEEIRRSLPSVYYFPAWEIMNDELRDYRFYGRDLVHPSEEAVAYLRLKFEEAFLRVEDEKFRRLTEEIQGMEQHRPLAAWSEEALRWQKRLAEKKEELAGLV
jgi:hypothetical protein